METRSDTSSTTTEELPSEVYDEINGLRYTLVGDYYLPAFAAPEAENYTHGIWARKRLRYLKSRKRWLYIELLTTGHLHAHMKETDEQAEEWMHRLPKELAIREGVTEDMKLDDPMRWVGLTNNIYARVRELINIDIIYA